MSGRKCAWMLASSGNVRAQRRQLVCCPSDCTSSICAQQVRTRKHVRPHLRRFRCAPPVLSLSETSASWVAPVLGMKVQEREPKKSHGSKGRWEVLRNMRAPRMLTHEGVTAQLRFSFSAVKTRQPVPHISADARRIVLPLLGRIH
jgi:hypothetical protein